MKVRFYGVRGSIAVSGEDTKVYGGNTSCVAVAAGGETLVFDAGTGIRPLGRDLGGDVDAHLFFSHLHWDHIQGFPFFTPAYVPGNRLSVYGVEKPGLPSLRESLAAQMTAPNFPVTLDAMRAELRFFDLPYGERIRVGPVVVRHTAVDHPNGCVAYRVDHGGRSVVYATDLEHGESVLHASLVELARGADLLVFDAMYTPEEYVQRRGWGHSTFEAGAAIAEDASVKTLALFHHDPAHDDAFMDALGERARARFPSTIVAREGLEVAL